MNAGNIPVITIQCKTIPEVWEKSLIETWNKGIAVKTQYDKAGDPPSRDVLMVMIIEEPFTEPRIHKCFPAGLENLEIYRQEVVDGVHDYWIKPEEDKWTYTYHQRLFNYIPALRLTDKITFNGKTVVPLGVVDRTLTQSPVNGIFVNQIKFIIDSLAKSPYSRRSQGITYMPSYDQGTGEPPCLQRIWCRCCYNDNNDLVLNMDTNWRSRDAYKAAFMNIFALTDLQRYIAEGISQKIGKEVKIGRYVDISDSYHIYGSYFEEFKGFLETVKNRTYESRVWNSTDEIVQAAFEDGRGILKRERETGEIGKMR